MSNVAITSDSVLDDPLLSTAAITDDLGITSRGLRKQIEGGRFPAPDANINGRNFWRSSTYRVWKTAALAGQFAQRRRIGEASQKAA